MPGSAGHVITFFQSCGVPRSILAELETELLTSPETVRKVHQVRTVLTQLNGAGDRCLRERREVIKRVAETEDFSTCWDDDRLEAIGLVAQVRARVDKHDAFARLERERQAAAALARQSREAELSAQRNRSRQLAEVRSQLAGLFGESDPQRRGRALEGLLNRYFAIEEISVREPFVFREASDDTPLEQIDGVIELDAHVYLVEVKWWAKQLSAHDLALHMVRVAHRGDVRGLVVSAAGYTPAALKTCRDELQRAVFVLCELRELVMWLERGDHLPERLREKIRCAQIDKEPLHLTL